MINRLYEVLAMAMRYWFALLGVLMVLRSFLWIAQDWRAKHRRLEKLPDAGMVGDLLVVEGSEELPEGAIIALPYEGTLGFVRGADVTVPANGVAGRHLDFSFQPGLGMLVYPRHGMTCRVDGQLMDSRSRARLTPLYHGSVLEVGEARLRVRFFAGVEAGDRAQRAAVKEDAPPAAPDAQEAPDAETEETSGGTGEKLFGQMVRREEERQPFGRPTLFGQPTAGEDVSPAAPDTRRRSGRRRGHGTQEETRQEED